MHISELIIDGYKNCKEQSKISFNSGLNILVGENASGKSTIINAIRMILKDKEMTYTTEEDFYKAFDKGDERKNIKIDMKFELLNPNEQITFLTWCDNEFNAELHLEIEKNPNPRGYYKKNVWGGKSKASAFEEETFDYIDTIYLPALRDAEEKLTNGRKSRLALLLKHQYKVESQKDKLVEAFNNFNLSIAKNESHDFNEIEKAKGDINESINKSMGSVFGQSVNLQFSESSFSSILQSIKMVFFPQLGETDMEKFRDIAINSLGYNNLLYIATVFAELEVINDEDKLFSVLLIEEPEAHLHPQIQSKLIKYLQDLVLSKKNLQIIITTHSSVLASSVSIDNIIHLSRKDTGIDTCKIKEFNLDENTKKYINRWLDVTKSTLLFSKGVILVEGISEAMLLPVLAPIILEEYNANHSEKQLPISLEEAGISVININGINFKYFFPLFCDCEHGNKRLPIRCSGITDRDPCSLVQIDENGKKEKIEQYPLEGEIVEGANEAIKLVESINNTEMARLFVSELKTFEYDLAMAGNLRIMAETIKEGWSKTGTVKSQCKSIVDKNNEYADKIHKCEDVIFIYKHIDCDELGKGIFAQLLAEKICVGKKFIVPQYIKDAVIWACGGCCE